MPQFFGVWILLHSMVFAFGFINFQLSGASSHGLLTGLKRCLPRTDNLTGARDMFGITYPIARSSALVLHVDVAFILLPVCRNFITLIRRTPLNGVIPFDSNITFRALVFLS